MQMYDPLMDLGYWLIRGFVAVIVIYFGLQAYAYIHVPVKGAIPIDYLTILAFPDAESYYPITAYWYDGTNVLTNREAVLETIRICLNDADGQIDVLTQPNGDPISNEPRVVAQLEFLRSYAIALAHAVTSYPDSIRFLVGRSLSGQVHYMIQYGNLAPINTLARRSRFLTAEFIWEVLAYRARGLVIAHVRDILPSYVKTWRKKAEHNIRGHWHLMYPYPKGEMMEPPIASPSPLVAEFALASPKLRRVLNMEKVYGRFARQAEQQTRTMQNIAFEKNVEAQDGTAGLIATGLDPDLRKRVGGGEATLMVMAGALIGVVGGSYAWGTTGGILGALAGIALAWYIGKSGVRL